MMKLDLDLSSLAPGLGNPIIGLANVFMLLSEFFDSIIVNNSLLCQTDFFSLAPETCMAVGIDKDAGWHLSKEFLEEKLDGMEYGI